MAPNQSIYLDCRPMGETVNPFSHTAKKLRAEKYPDKASVERATAVVRWLEYLGKALAWVQTKDPLMSAVIAKCANDGQARKELIQTLQAIDAEIAKAAQQHQPAQIEYKIPD